MKKLTMLVLIVSFCFSFAIIAQELEIPTANTNIKGTVKLNIIKQAALSHSRMLWGKVSIGIIIPQCDFEGNIVAYEISFSTRHPEFPSYSEIMESITRGRGLVEEGYVTGDKRLYERGRMLRWGVNTYRTAVISARYDMYPIPEYSTGLSPFYTTGDLARQKAADLLGTADIKLTRMYYAGHMNRWFEFTASNGRSILVDVFSLQAHQPGNILVKQPKQAQKAEDLEFIKANNLQAWEKIKSGIRIINYASAARTISNVPFYDWSFGCSPTSSAMILGYYDDKGYHKLVDYYFDRWDPIESEWDYDVPNVQRELAQAMKTESGSTLVKNIAPGNTYVTNNINGYHFESIRSPWGSQANNFNWDLIKNEINAGRPFHWAILDYFREEHGTYIDHSVVAVGYTNNYYVVVHNTWDTREHNWYYYSNVGGTISYSLVINIIPIGNRPPYLNAIGSKSAREGEALQFTISGRDPDNDPIRFSAQNLPAGATFNPATRTFSWVPSYTQSGVYTVTFKVSDAKLSDFEDVEITVVNVKRLVPKP